MAVGAEGPLRLLLYPYLVVAFALMVTVLHHRALRRGRPELRAVLLYFLAFALLFLALPLLIVYLCAGDAAAFLRAAGLAPGRVGRGLALTAAALPFCLLAAFVGSRHPGMRAQYPLAKEACRVPAVFIVYEAAYLFLYYLPWEFLYRGLLFLALVPVLGLLPALALQTVVSTLHHAGHPDVEIWAAGGAGLVFGMVAWVTASFLYTAIIHAVAGIATDTLLCRRSRG
ncbi:MAG: CPBP family intramembrane metalloprotease [Candidatus Aminicenantes bacterium]|nr:CPBP family intramembrane metalloprotease [Candidatus Aminicenantes bacterium]